MEQERMEKFIDGSKITEESAFENEMRVDTASEHRKTGTYSINSILPDTFKNIEAYSKGEFIGFPTGFRDLEFLTGGFQSGELVILGGIPGMGKTALALSIAGNGSIDHKKRVLYVSTKESKPALVQRLLIRNAMVNGHLLRTGRLPQRDYPKLSIAIGPITEAPLYFCCEPRVTIKSITEAAKALKSERSLDFLIVDHLQMVLVNPAQQNKYEDVTIVVNELKRLARELNIVILALSAMNRTARDRNSPEPRLSDLGDSGAIETTSDTVMLLHRAEVFDLEAEKGKAELHVAKQNSGPTGIIPLVFVAEYASFLNYSRNPIE